MNKELTVAIVLLGLVAVSAIGALTWALLRAIDRPPVLLEAPAAVASVGRAPCVESIGDPTVGTVPCAGGSLSFDGGLARCECGR